MNWFVSEPVSAESMIQAGLPFLEALCALVVMIAVLMLLIGLLHTVSAVRSSNSHLEWYRFGEAKQRVFRVTSTPAPRRNLLRVAHLRSWLLTR